MRSMISDMRGKSLTDKEWMMFTEFGFSLLGAISKEDFSLTILMLKVLLMVIGEKSL